MPPKQKGRKGSELDQFLEPIQVEIEGAQLRLRSVRVLEMYKLLKCEAEMMNRELLAQGKCLYYPAGEPLTKPLFWSRF